MEQPIPNVTAADVERIVRRDFPDRTDEAMKILCEYDSDNPHRVRAAVLKLASGNMERLRGEVETARRDFRDVLSSAEYPDYTRKVVYGKTPPDEIRQIIEADWKQYRDWMQG